MSAVALKDLPAILRIANLDLPSELREGAWKSKSIVPSSGGFLLS